MLHTLNIDSYGLHNPPTVVHVVEDDSIARDREHAAEEEFDFEAWARDTVERVEKLTADAESGKVDPEPAIERLAGLEAELRPLWQQVRRTHSTSQNLQSQALRLPVSLRADLLAQGAMLLNKIAMLLTPIESVLRAYRDGRWELMAIQAEQEPESEAPVFEDAKSLLAYLD